MSQEPARQKLIYCEATAQTPDADDSIACESVSPGSTFPQARPAPLPARAFRSPPDGEGSRFRPAASLETLARTPSVPIARTSHNEYYVNLWGWRPSRFQARRSVDFGLFERDLRRVIQEESQGKESTRRRYILYLPISSGLRFSSHLRTSSGSRFSLSRVMLRLLLMTSSVT